MEILECSGARKEQAGGASWPHRPQFSPPAVKSWMAMETPKETPKEKMMRATRGGPAASPDRSGPIARLYWRAIKGNFETAGAEEIFYHHLNSLINPKQSLDVDLEKDSFLDTLKASYRKHPQATDMIEDYEELIKFCEEFFSSDLIQELLTTLDLARGSTLGVGYVCRGTFMSVAIKLLNYACSVARELLAVSLAVRGADTEEWLTVGRGGKISKNSEEGGGAGRADPSASGGGQGGPSGRGQSGRHQGGRGGGGGGRGGGRGSDGPGGQDWIENEFSKISVQEIEVKSFTSPERPTAVSTMDERVNRRLTVRGFAEKFMADSALSDYGVNGRYFYNLFDSNDPRDKQRTVAIFHGTRRSHLQNFRNLGIRPSSTPSEFSTEAAFYCTNYLQVAYEHALLNQVGNSRIVNMHGPANPSLELNAVLVHVFSVDTDVLQGYSAPAQGEAPFKTWWFPTPSAQWKKFCLANWRGEESREEYDVIFGPICVPAWNVEVPKDDSGKVSSVVKTRFISSNVRVENKHTQEEEQVYQIAFLSKRSRLWLQQHLTGMLLESRVEEV